MILSGHKIKCQIVECSAVLGIRAYNSIGREREGEMAPAHSSGSPLRGDRGLLPSQCTICSELRLGSCLFVICK